MLQRAPLTIEDKQLGDRSSAPIPHSSDPNHKKKKKKLPGSIKEEEEGGGGAKKKIPFGEGERERERRREFNI